ncbi:MAG: DUF2794 domain-containing protein [Micavibrio sp.]|jgi:hypothetical protein|nr:MAG: DUF2794 domain-containing protein [Micavibrio sp.]
MAQFFSLYGQRYPGQNVTFNKHELGQILSVYGTRVSKGEWKDYALDCTGDSAMFSIFRHSNEKPAFVVSKTVGRGHMKRQARYSVMMEGKTVSHSNSLLEALEVFYDKERKKER